MGRDLTSACIDLTNRCHEKQICLVLSFIYSVLPLSHKDLIGVIPSVVVTHKQLIGFRTTSMDLRTDYFLLEFQCVFDTCVCRLFFRLYVKIDSSFFGA